MKLLDLLRKVKVLRFSAGMILIGLVMGVISVIGLTAPKAEYIPVEATIVRIDESYDPTAYGGDGGTNYTVYVRYRAEGQWYDEAELGAYSSGMKEGDVIDIEYNAEDPSVIQTPGSEKIPYITCAVGFIAAAAGVFLFIRNVKKPADSFNEYDKVDKAKISPALAESIRTSNETQKRYYFHFDKSIKQGYILEDADKNPVIEAKMKTINPLKPMEFEFIDHRTGLTETKMIGHTVSASIGSGQGFGTNISSYFKIDGVKNWDWLAEKGYGFEYMQNGLKPCFMVQHYGVETAYIETTGTNLHEDDKKPLGNLPINGYFRIDCRESELNDIFMVAFSIARAIFYENN